MNINKVEEAEREARRTLEHLERVREQHEQYGRGIFFGSKETARLRRASQDLSESLIELRRPG